MKFKAVWELLRLEHGFMYGSGVIVGIIVSAGIDFSSRDMVLGVLTAVFLQASAFALNDYFDYEVDLANRRFDRPLVRGDLSRRTAFMFFALLAPLGFLTAILISIEAFLLALAVTLAGYLYDIKLKEYGFAGNVYIAFSMATPFIFGSVVATKTVVSSACVLALLAFFSGIGREVMKGIEDVEGDAIRDVKTVARMRGIRNAANLSALMFVFSVFLSFIPPLLLAEYFLDLKYILPVILADILLVSVSLNLLKGKFEKDYIRKYRKETLVAMSFGLAGFFAGAF